MIYSKVFRMVSLVPGTPSLPWPHPLSGSLLVILLLHNHLFWEAFLDLSSTPKLNSVTVSVGLGGCNRTHRLGGLANKIVFSHNPGGSESKIQVSVLGFQPAASLGVLTRSHPAICVVLNSSYKDTNHIGSGPTLVASFYLNHLFKGLCPDTATF